MSFRILVVCTANRCRSPMAEALLARRLPAAAVSSAGSLPGGHPASGGSVRAMAARGIDLGDYVSRELSRPLVEDADLVVCMARCHLREVAVLLPMALERTFTVRELVRRGEAVGPAVELDAWLADVGRGRSPADLVADDEEDDVADPIGGPDSGYEATARQLEDLIERLGRLLDRIGQPAR